MEWEVRKKKKVHQLGGDFDKKAVHLGNDLCIWDPAFLATRKKEAPRAICRLQYHSFIDTLVSIVNASNLAFFTSNNRLITPLSNNHQDMPAIMGVPDLLPPPNP